ncbi:MAG: hypothetical protein ACLSGK_12525 [Lachnospiraceae bacterium]
MIDIKNEEYGREGKVMEKNHATPILASYVTYKELSSHGNYKSPYQILAEFIKYIIYEKTYMRFQ